MFPSTWTIQLFRSNPRVFCFVCILDAPSSTSKYNNNKLNPFSDFEPDDNRRPEILIRNPYGSGKQLIIDVAVTGIDGTTRTNDDKPDQPLDERKKQKQQKYGETANQNGLALVAAIFLSPAKCTRISNIFSLNKLDFSYN